ncbi:hypothetical protein THAOC_18153 [Thalassiosira oceanica]|uniref:Uncharacterized protein n=1 Tax=Thalassiosira oceanica TaxID=159749 RepID=K0S7X0_THAOC|nr:hypothetical protein THAOC_18153 [Thalassiosira oceanica]|eukprot:EJK61375.1 hypothetical protein THAOC_18153 [Thalassiosira oceanica]
MIASAMPRPSIRAAAGLQRPSVSRALPAFPSTIYLMMRARRVKPTDLQERNLPKGTIVGFNSAHWAPPSPPGELLVNLLLSPAPFYKHQCATCSSLKLVVLIFTTMLALTGYEISEDHGTNRRKSEDWRLAQLGNTPYTRPFARIRNIRFAATSVAGKCVTWLSGKTARDWVPSASEMDKLMTDGASMLFEVHGGRSQTNHPVNPSMCMQQRAGTRPSRKQDRPRQRLEHCPQRSERGAQKVHQLHDTLALKRRGITMDKKVSNLTKLL